MNKLLRDDYLHIFDTNAIYCMCGEDSESFDSAKFRRDLKDMKFKIIPSCVFTEVIVKYRNNTEKIKKSSKI